LDQGHRPDFNTHSNFWQTGNDFSGRSAYISRTNPATMNPFPSKSKKTIRMWTFGRRTNHFVVTDEFYLRSTSICWQSVFRTPTISARNLRALAQFQRDAPNPDPLTLSDWKHYLAVGLSYAQPAESGKGHTILAATSPTTIRRGQYFDNPN